MIVLHEDNGSIGSEFRTEVSDIELQPNGKPEEEEEDLDTESKCDNLVKYKMFNPCVIYNTFHYLTMQGHKRLPEQLKP